MDFNSKIKTNKGIKTLKEIFDFFGYDINDYDENGIWLKIPDEGKGELKVYDKNNQLKDINNLFYNGYDEVYEFNTEDGKTIQCTENHKFLVLTSNGEKKWKKAKDLNKNDEIVNY